MYKIVFENIEKKKKNVNRLIYILFLNDEKVYVLIIVYNIYYT